MLGIALELKQGVPKMLHELGGSSICSRLQEHQCLLRDWGGCLATLPTLGGIQRHHPTEMVREKWRKNYLVLLSPVKHGIPSEFWLPLEVGGWR